MNRIKKLLFKLSPNAYYFLRDRFQFLSLQMSGEFRTIQSESSTLTGVEDTFIFTKRRLSTHQVKSEIFDLIAALQALEPATYVEIGVADGGTHLMIRRLCGTIRKTVAIDTDIRNKLLIDRLTSTRDSQYILGSSTSAKTRARFAKIFPEPGSLDVLFIDGDHSYEGVKSDFKCYHHYVRSGGYIVLHDIVEDWGQRYGRKTNKYTGGVPKYFAEIKGDYQHFTFVDDPEQDGFGIGVLIQP